MGQVTFLGEVAKLLPFAAAQVLFWSKDLGDGTYAVGPPDARIKVTTF